MIFNIIGAIVKWNEKINEKNSKVESEKMQKHLPNFKPYLSNFDSSSFFYCQYIVFCILTLGEINCCKRTNSSSVKALLVSDVTDSREFVSLSI